MSNIKKKTAEVVLNEITYDVEATVREEAFVFVKKYDEIATQKIKEFLESKMNFIERKLKSRGYFFDGEIQNCSYSAELIEFILNNVFSKNIGYGAELGQAGKAIYVDKNFISISGIKPIEHIKELYEKHYGIN